VWNLIHQAHALGIPVFMKEDLLPIMGEAQMVQEFPTAFYRVLEEQKTWQK
jgi:type III secretion system FlhB-like substrate exporter